MKNVLIIGAGPGGYVAAIKLAQLGAKVTLVEKYRVGGTCLNVGCIPTKSLLHSAEVYQMVREAGDYGISAKEVGFDWQKIQEKKAKTTDHLVNSVDALLRIKGVELVLGTASFIGNKKVEVSLEDGSKKVFEPDDIIIASGSKPSLPPIKGLKESKYVIDSDGALALKKLPKSMCIIGGGVIGIELASVFAEFGTQVSVLEAMESITPNMDTECAGYLAEYLKSRGVNILNGTFVQEINGNKVVYKKHDEEAEISSDLILVATGRTANSESLNLEKAGVKSERGRVIVDDKMQTNVSGIYAIGDVTGRVMLAHTASMMGEVAAENIMGADLEYDESVVPAAVYTLLEFASVGKREEDLKKAGTPYTVGMFPFENNSKAYIAGNKGGVVKLIFGAKYKEVLGVHILGEKASELISSMGVLIKLESTQEEIESSIYAHPSVSEAIREAALAAENRAIHAV